MRGLGQRESECMWVEENGLHKEMGVIVGVDYQQYVTECGWKSNTRRMPGRGCKCGTPYRECG